jgi:ATP-dependent exoDNAse (exonuclease V) alpha subunit
MIIRRARQFNLAALKQKFLVYSEYGILNDGQKDFFHSIFDGRNTFLTGDPGTGKSFCVRVLRRFLEENKVFVGIAATTGVAALNVGGSTIHSFSGIGLADEPASFLIKKVEQNKKAKRRVKNCQLLIIDEVSMAGSLLLDKVDAVFRAMRNPAKPFGGVQVLFVGDFMQLLPVFREIDDDLAFNSTSWKEANINTVQLTELVRQSADMEFGGILKQVRVAELKNFQPLLDRIGAKLDGPTRPIHIFCKNVDVDKFNLNQLNAIQSPARTFVAKDKGEERFIQFFDKNCQAPRELTLKIGAQVMLLTNLDTEGALVNGSLGIVTGFTSCNEPIVDFEGVGSEIIGLHDWEIKEQVVNENGEAAYKILATRSQFPLRLAYGITVHKSQGATFEKAVLDLNEVFCEGQAYVALSRLRSLKGLSLKSFDPKKIWANEECLEFYNNLK